MFYSLCPIILSKGSCVQHLSGLERERCRPTQCQPASFPRSTGRRGHPLYQQFRPPSATGPGQRAAGRCAETHRRGEPVVIEGTFYKTKRRITVTDAIRRITGEPILYLVSPREEQLLTPEETFHGGWDYLPKMGRFGVITLRNYS